MPSFADIRADARDRGFFFDRTGIDQAEIRISIRGEIDEVALK